MLFTCLSLVYDSPIFAIPSVQMRTLEPGGPLEARAMEQTRAGPSAVCPLSRKLNKQVNNNVNK